MGSRLIKLIALCVMAIGSAVSVYAQTSVSGRVTDQEGEPIVGATVLIKGTLTGTQTNFEGRYTIEVKDPDKAVIQFSCLGYRDVEESVKTKAVINVAMWESNESLDEVVVVGYGTQKKVNLTGSVTAVNMSEIGENRTIVSASAALAGLVPGMSVQQTAGGQPGSEGATLRIRGVGSFTSSASSPLVLVDGVEWDMDNLNPNDIESISVLKDASSTAIYGTRAANGVVLVTTKTGEANKPRVSYSFKGIFQKPYNKLKLVDDSVTYFNAINEANENAGESHTYSDATIAAWEAANADPYGTNEYGVPNYIAYPNTNWFDEIFNTGFSQEHNISFSGGSKAVRYMVSASYLDNTGILTNYGLDSGERKYTVRANIEADVTKWFTLGNKFYGQLTRLGHTNLEHAFSYVLGLTPYVYPGTPEKWGHTHLTEGRSGQNFYYSAWGFGGDDRNWRINETMYFKIRPYKDVSIEGNFNYAPYIRIDHKTYIDSGMYNYYTDTQYSTPSLDQATVTYATQHTYQVQADLLARYHHTWKNIHDFTAMAGYSAIYSFGSWYFAFSKKGATDLSLTDGSTYSEINSTSNTPPSDWGLRSYFARFNYVLKDRYMFEANIRADGSSRFGSETRYGVFPSFSAGWKIHEEPWMANAAGWLSELKLRASWGQAGNNQGIGNYSWQATYTTGNDGIDASNAVGLYISSMSNINLKWETTSTTDIGIDAGFFNNRLTSEIDYYYKATKDILYTPSTYLTMGNFSAVPQNLGNLWNQGIEIALNWKDTVGNGFYYYVGANFSYNKNMVTKFKGKFEGYWDEDGNYVYNYNDVAESWDQGILLEGHSIGEYYYLDLYKGTGKGYSGGEVDPNAGPKDGMIRTESDMEWVRAMIDAGYTFQGGNTVSKTQLWYGDFIYADNNGDGNYGNTYDRIFTGKLNSPPFNLGINFGFAWKGLEFSMIWSGMFGGYLPWNATYFNTPTIYTGMAIGQQLVDDHYFYDPDNPTDSRTNIYGYHPRFYPTDKNRDNSTFYLYNSDYMKLKNVTIAYTIPEKWTKKFFVQQLKFYVTGENLLTITNYPGLDPELGTNGLYSNYQYPLMRQYTVGAQITF